MQTRASTDNNISDAEPPLHLSINEASGMGVNYLELGPFWVRQYRIDSMTPRTTEDHLLDLAAAILWSLFDTAKHLREEVSETDSGSRNDSSRLNVA
ncbi:MAG TPA: hypothetical protein VLW55_08395 [Burkholderiaceae bacterium]|nr:hypothetical protein [Burkholderiaceae bacterium]